MKAGKFIKVSDLIVLSVKNEFASSAAAKEFSVKFQEFVEENELLLC